jgi:hypothetical protein
MQLQSTSTVPSGTRGGSWLNRVVDRIKPQPAEPESPAPPPVDQTQWEKSVEEHKVNTLTVHDVGLIVFNETQSYTDRDNANDTIGGGREKIAHAVINGDAQLGRKRPVTAAPIQPSAKALKDPRTRAAYDSSLIAAREAYLSPTDPTHGATHFQFLTNADKSNMKFSNGTPEGLPLKTQSGPFTNSYLGNHVKSHQVYVNTYGQD